MISRVSRPFVAFFKNEEGVTAVECALLLALVVAICLVRRPTPAPRSGPAGHPRAGNRRGLTRRPASQINSGLPVPGGPRSFPLLRPASDWTIHSWVW